MTSMCFKKCGGQPSSSADATNYIDWENWTRAVAHGPFGSGETVHSMRCSVYTLMTTTTCSHKAQSHFGGHQPTLLKSRETGRITNVGRNDFFECRSLSGSAQCPCLVERVLLEFGMARSE